MNNQIFVLNKSFKAVGINFNQLLLLFWWSFKFPFVYKNVWRQKEKVNLLSFKIYISELCKFLHSCTNATMINEEWIK